MRAEQQHTRTGSPPSDAKVVVVKEVEMTDVNSNMNRPLSPVPTTT